MDINSDNYPKNGMLITAFVCQKSITKAHGRLFFRRRRTSSVINSDNKRSAIERSFRSSHNAQAVLCNPSSQASASPKLACRYAEKGAD